ncbi:MAG: hypothetical protein GY724_00400 [Actinomycetia bacterium]|nr:hypothetical protein [Actinomycetes bacterium]MCP4224445.1 hypothetical protein [Actinomycetes bacterium]
MISSIGWPVVFSSGFVGLVILVPAAGLAWVLVDNPDRPQTWAFLVVALLAFTAAGFVAGRRRRDIPMIHGGLAALGTFVVAQLIGMGVQLAGGYGISLAAVVMGALLAVSCGVWGALGADWLARVRGRRQPIGTPTP